MFSNKNKVVADNIINYTIYDEIDVEDRVFVTWNMFEEAMETLHGKLIDHQKEKQLEFDAIYAPPRGGLCLGVKLSYMTKIPLITDPSKVTSSTVVIDDCTKSGKTMMPFRDNVTLVMFQHPKSVFTPTIYYQETDKQINFCWESKDERN
ncbi:MAG: hypothetical protein ABIF08_03760 [Nanoarchaeota archaeon]